MGKESRGRCVPTLLVLLMFRFHSCERHFRCPAPRTLFPGNKQPGIVICDVIRFMNAQAVGNGIDPFGWALDLGEISDRSLVNHDVSSLSLPFGAKFLIAKTWRKLKLAQYSFHLFAV